MLHDESIICVKGLHKTCDAGKIKVRALRGINLTVRWGMVAIMGSLPR